MAIESRIWTSPVKMRMIIESYAKTLASLSAVNGFYMFYNEVWLLLVINIFFFIPAIITIISKAKYNKLPPKDETKIK